MGERRRKFLESLPLAKGQTLLAYGSAAAISCAALAIRVAVNDILPPGYPYVVFFPAVILSAFLFGRGPGIVSATLCGLAAWYFFIAPARSLRLDGGIILSLLFYLNVVVIDIALVHWMQSANRRLVRERERGQVLVERSELLFRELQHRISNNLQVVGALLALQRRDVADPGARAALDDASRRMGLIGRMHRQLHDPSGARQDMATFLRSIADDLLDTAGRDGIAVTIDVDPAIALAPDAAIPVSLVVAEAIANALEHGFDDRDHGQIAIGLARDDGQAVVLTIADDGRGLPDGFVAADSPSLGLRIARTLTGQLGGSHVLVPREGGGALCRVTLPIGRDVRIAGS